MTLLTSGGKLVYPFVLHTPENQALFEACCCGQPNCFVCANQAPTSLVARFKVNGIVQGAIPLTRADAGIPSYQNICENLGGGTIALDPKWSGQGDVCDGHFCVCLLPCQSGTESNPPPGPCVVGGMDKHWRLKISYGGCDNPVSTIADVSNECESATCSPLHLVFPVGITLLPLICGFMTGVWTIDVDEV